MAGLERNLHWTGSFSRNKETGMDDHTERVRRRAYLIWLDEGRPAGREAAHWGMASELVAIEEHQTKTTKPVRRAAGEKVVKSKTPAVKESATVKTPAAKPEPAVTGRPRSTKVAEKKAAPPKSVPTKTPATKAAPAAKPEIRPATRKSETVRTQIPRSPKK
jgi:hypothetical protein